MAATSRGRLLVVAVVALGLVAGIAVVVRTYFGSATSPFVADTCTFDGYEVDPGQASVAATMIGAVTKYRIDLPTRAQVLVLAAAFQESKLRNIAPGDGDRDSVGVLQQRPSQDWGGKENTIAERTENLTDVGEATKEFLDALMKIDGWAKLPAAEAIQKVQISADGSLYAQHEGQATALAAALSGRTPHGISCEFDAPSETASAATVAEQIGDELGIDTPTVTGTGTIRVPGAGWQSASWFVANADRLGIEQVDYAGRQWTRDDGWTTKSGVSSAAVVATLAKV